MDNSDDRSDSITGFNVNRPKDQGGSSGYTFGAGGRAAGARPWTVADEIGADGPSQSPYDDQP
jgi:hypothetical protein